MPNQHTDPVQRRRGMSKAMVVKITGVTFFLLAAVVAVFYFTGYGQAPVVSHSTSAVAP